MDGELGRLLDEATGALSRLDAEQLGELERRARRLKAAMDESSAAMTGPELAARFRVFAHVVQATGRNLGILRRDDGIGYGAGWGAGGRWGR